MTPALTFTIQGKLDSKSNDRPGHWATRHRKSRLQREHAGYATLQVFRSQLRIDPAMWFFEVGRGQVTVRLIRCSLRKLDDDNLRDAFKSIRDGISDQFGVADNHKRLAFEYGQERQPFSTPAHVRIEIRDSDKEPR